MNKDWIPIIYVINPFCFFNTAQGQQPSDTIIKDCKMRFSLTLRPCCTKTTKPIVVSWKRVIVLLYLPRKTVGIDELSLATMVWNILDNYGSQIEKMCHCGPQKFHYSPTNYIFLGIKQWPFYTHCRKFTGPVNMFFWFLSKDVLFI